MIWKVDKSCNGLFESCESPAEKKFAYYMASMLGLQLDVLSELSSYGPTDYTAWELEKRLKLADRSCDTIQTMRIMSQAQRVNLPYRADFVITFGGPMHTPFYKEIWLEIDGHDFHERTKAQAARDRKKDRAVIAAGFHLMRFTASETHNDPEKCLREILDVIVADAWKLPIKHVEYTRDGKTGGKSTD